ncbi:hypothetical protein RIF29_06798 [Crotalaria pallida]|uniref:Uncharacterized protein n=1 Tax=Crotalaria pallida TaxID=3830 RepID=A0AAN9PBH6_CROPI
MVAGWGAVAGSSWVGLGLLRLGDEEGRTKGEGEGRQRGTRRKEEGVFEGRRRWGTKGRTVVFEGRQRGSNGAVRTVLRLWLGLEAAAGERRTVAMGEVRLAGMKEKNEGRMREKDGGVNSMLLIM